MPTNECIPFFDDAKNLTGTASATIVGKTFVAISGNQAADLTWLVATCGAGNKSFGVAEYNALTGQFIGIIRRGVLPVTVGAVNLAAGVEVMSDANGLAVIWDGVVGHRPLGICLTAAIAGSDAPIALYQ